MRTITLEEIEKATGGTLISGSRSESVSGVCTDSRQAGCGDLFVPLIGEVHDAHRFIPQAAAQGCCAFLVSREEAAPADVNVVLVRDTIEALQKLSAWYLDTLHLKKIAVTGSVGKTSTRDMVYHILKEKYRAGTTVGNFNNDIGVPLTIFSFDDSMEAAVLEVGMDHFDEIHRLVDIIRPEIGIITNVGISHIENLGSREGILKAKMEITDFFDRDSVLVINSANDMLQKVQDTEAYHLIRIGTEPGADYFVHDIDDRGEKGVSYSLTAEGETYRIDLSIPGAHNALNSALAIAACGCFGITICEAQCGLAGMELTGKRLTVREAGGIRVIDDTYNAAPDSMKAAVDTLMHTEGMRHTAVLAGMNELGPDSKWYHEEVGRYAAEQNVDRLMTVGEKAVDIAAGAAGRACEVLHFDTKEALCEQIGDLFGPGDVVVVKGSRSMQMEQVVDRIIEEQE